MAFIKEFISDMKKTRWNKVKPTMRTFGITLLILIAVSTFVFLISWGITAMIAAMKGNK